MDFRVFYSWQSDSPKKTNLNAIRQALCGAGKCIELRHVELKFIADEATRDTSGSPNIALKILEKIERADVFVADITTVTLPGAERPCPNPNVIYELGYAVGQLGWDRVILLFNQAHGKFPDDLPFDLIQQRASPYLITEAAPKTEHADLTKFLEVAINAVIEKNPKTPVELRGFSREKLEHEHDVENIEWLMSTIHLPTLDQHILELPRIIDDRVFWFWEGFKGVVTNSLFSLYDKTLENSVADLFIAWQSTLSFYQRYNGTPNGQRYIFSNLGDAPLSNEQQVDWDAIEAARDKMAQALQALLNRLRESYIEVHLQKTNAKAWGEFVKDQKDFQKMFSD
ncbi:MAG: hypothetical protein ABL869_04455 [Candidatus Nitrotoga sp.]